MAELLDLDDLVVVAGHAVYVAEGFDDPAADASWCLHPFQRGEPDRYLGQIRRGVELAAANERTLLLFSGGQTRADAGPRSEASGYFRLARHFGFWGHESVGERASTEEYARDSLENLLFGIARFRQCTGRIPREVTVVSWPFKEERFGLHVAALRFPEERFHFEGHGEPLDPDGTLAGESQAVAAFRDDPYGCRTSPEGTPAAECVLLGDKRARRDPFARVVPYAESCPELADLLAHRGPERFAGPLPW